MRVVLTGFMGTGKTAVGRRVAERTGRPFLDTDDLVERDAGRSVQEIFAAEGEPAFRALERRAVERACAQRDAVIATGGGALLDDRNFERLADGGVLICLTAEPAAIARRVRAAAASRPLLGGRAGLAARIRNLLAERAPIYARVPDSVDTTARTVEQVADEIIARWASAEREQARQAKEGGRREASPPPRSRGKAAAR